MTDIEVLIQIRDALYLTDSMILICGTFWLVSRLLRLLDGK